MASSDADIKACIDVFFGAAGKSIIILKDDDFHCEVMYEALCSALEYYNRDLFSNLDKTELAAFVLRAVASELKASMIMHMQEALDDFIRKKNKH